MRDGAAFGSVWDVVNLTVQFGRNQIGQISNRQANPRIPA
jgi:hypothetical protein